MVAAPSNACHEHHLPDVIRGVACVKEMMPGAWVQASTQGLVAELQRRGEAEGARVLCPVPLVSGGLTEPPVVPRFLASLQVGLNLLRHTNKPCIAGGDMCTQPVVASE